MDRGGTVIAIRGRRMTILVRRRLQQRGTNKHSYRKPPVLVIVTEEKP